MVKAKLNIAKTKLPRNLRRLNIEELQNSRSPLTPAREIDDVRENEPASALGKRDEIKTLKNLAQKLGTEFNDEDTGGSSKEMRINFYDHFVTSIAAEDDEVPVKIARLLEQRKVRENAQDLKKLNKIHRDILRGRFDSIMKITPSDLTKIFDYLHLGPQPHSSPSPKVQDILSSKWYSSESNQLHNRKENEGQEEEEEEENPTFDVGVLKCNTKYLRSLESSLSIPIPLKILNIPTTINDDDDDENSTKETTENLRLRKNNNTIASLKNDIQDLEKELRQLKILKDGTKKVLKELGGSLTITTNNSHELPDFNTLKATEMQLITELEEVLELIKTKFKVRSRSIEKMLHIIVSGKVPKDVADKLCPTSIGIFMNQLQILRVEKTSTKSRLKLNDFS